MKLRNKKTGDIWKLNVNGEGDLWVSNGFEFYNIDSIKQLADTFEDVEPEEVWYIDYQGTVRSALKEENNWFKENEIGNYFETEEEAEKAVEKLKALKRLKDKGFGFESWWGGSKDISFWIDTEIDENIAEDLDLLFGGEE